MAAEIGIGINSLFLDCPDALIHPLEPVFNGLHQVGDRLGTRLQIGLGGLLEAGERSRGELEKLLIVRFQRVGGKRSKGFPEANLGCFKDSELFPRRAPFSGQLYPQATGLGSRLFAFGSLNRQAFNFASAFFKPNAQFPLA